MTRSEWKRMRGWLVRFLAAEAVLVAVFAWCCASVLDYEEPEPLVLIRDVPVEVPVEVTVAPEPAYPGPSEEAVALAKTVWGEARGCSTTEQAGVIWCVLNRVDSGDPDFPDDIISVVSQPGRFDGYSPDYPVEEDILVLCEDVLARWELEKMGVGSVGRVLPADYLFFEGDGTHNHFRKEYISTGETWNWCLASPYEDGFGRKYV